MKRTCSSLFVTALSWFVPSLAFAGSGLEVADLGTVPLGRGTAFVARADNLMAYHYNPAGMSKKRKWNVLLSMNVLQMNTTFSRRGSGGLVTLDEGTDTEREVWDPEVDPRTGEAYEKVLLERKFSPVPSVIVSYGDVGNVQGLSLFGGLVPASSFGFPKFDARGAQRYAMQEAELLQVYPGVGISYMPNRYISVGATFMVGMTVAKFHQAARSIANPYSEDNEDDRNDVAFGIEVHDFWSPTGSFGVLSNPVDWLEIGASLRLPVWVEAKGELEFTASEANPDDELEEGAEVVLKQSFPLVVRAGARYIHKWFDFEVDYVFDNWAMLDSFDLALSGTVVTASGPVTLPDTKLPKNFRNAHSVRIGSDIEAWPEHLAVRVGGWYQSSAYPEDYSTFNVDFPFAQQGGVSAGLTWHVIPQLDISAAYAHVIQDDVTVTDGVLQQLTSNEPNFGNVVNNGTYTNSLNIFGISFEGHFGLGGKKKRGAKSQAAPATAPPTTLGEPVPASNPAATPAPASSPTPMPEPEPAPASSPAPAPDPSATGSQEQPGAPAANEPPSATTPATPTGSSTSPTASPGSGTPPTAPPATPGTMPRRISA